MNREEIAKEYGIELLAHAPLDEGADLQATLYRLEGARGKSYFAKCKKESLGAEISEALHSLGHNFVIPPLRTRQGKLSVGELTLFPFVEGKSGFTTPLDEAQWIAFGKALRALHETELPKEIAAKIPQESFSVHWPEIATAKLKSDDEAGRGAAALVEKEQEKIQTLIERAKKLHKKVSEKKFPSVFCHSDIHAGNVLIDREGKFYIIDWDAPLFAPKERDLMFLGAGVGGVWNNPFETALFFQGYGKTDLDHELISYYRHTRILEDITEFIGLLYQNRGSQKERLQMLEYFRELFADNEVVEIASSDYKNCT